MLTKHCEGKAVQQEFLLHHSWHVILDCLPPAVHVPNYDPCSGKQDASYLQSGSEAAKGKRQGVVHLSCDGNGNIPEAGCISPVTALA